MIVTAANVATYKDIIKEILIMLKNYRKYWYT